MLVERLAIRNLGLNGRRSLLIGLLIAACTAIALVCNSFFQSSTAGFKQAVVNCFSGDLFISSPSERPLSLFGEDIPIVGSYAPIPALVRQDQVLTIVDSQPAVAAAVTQISGYAVMEVAGYRAPVVLFGVDGDAYFQAFKSVRLAAGGFLRTTSPGIMLSEKKLKEIGLATGNRPPIGAPIQVSVFANHGFSIREVPLVGTFRYPASGSVLDRIAYVDARTLRALNGMTQNDSKADVLPLGARSYLEQDVGSIFDSDSDSAATSSGVRLNDVESLVSGSNGQRGAAAPERGSWNFIVIKLKPGTNPLVAKRDLEKRLQAEGLDARVGDWRAAAGSTAALASSVSLAFNVGLGMLALVIVLILTNSFVTVTIERTSEIATMRAMGARKGFVRSLVLAEAIILSALAGAAGCLAGAAVVIYLKHRGIPTSNRILSMIFGGDTVRPVLTPSAIAVPIVAAIVVGGLSSLYAVRLALKILPARAMEIE